MASMQLHILLFVLMIQSSSSVECTQGDCIFDCGSIDCNTVICTDTANSCTINCGSNDCHSSTFYLAATNNIVNCIGSDSCKYGDFYCGIPDNDNIPSSYSLTDFDGHIDQCIFTLSNNAIADGGHIKCYHNIDLCQVKATTDNDDFKESLFECELSPINSQCIMDCYTEKSCGDETSRFECYAPDCECNGEGCDDLSQIRRTAPPSTKRLGTTTTTTLNPTQAPSISPTEAPTTTISTPAPTVISLPPTANTPSPTRITSNPTENSMPPTMNTLSPTSDTASPTTDTASPTMVTPSPTANTLSPTATTAASTFITVTSTIYTPSPTANTPSPTLVTTAQSIPAYTISPSPQIGAGSIFPIPKSTSTSPTMSEAVISTEEALFSTTKRSQQTITTSEPIFAKDKDDTLSSIERAHESGETNVGMSTTTDASITPNKPSTDEFSLWTASIYTKLAMGIFGGITIICCSIIIIICVKSKSTKNKAKQNKMNCEAGVEIHAAHSKKKHTYSSRPSTIDLNITRVMSRSTYGACSRDPEDDDDDEDSEGDHEDKFEGHCKLYVPPHGTRRVKSVPIMSHRTHETHINSPSPYTGDKPNDHDQIDDHYQYRLHNNEIKINIGMAQFGAAETDNDEDDQSMDDLYAAPEHDVQTPLTPNGRAAARMVSTSATSGRHSNFNLAFDPHSKPIIERHKSCPDYGDV